MLLFKVSLDISERKSAREEAMNFVQLMYNIWQRILCASAGVSFKFTFCNGILVGLNIVTAKMELSANTVCLTLTLHLGATSRQGYTAQGWAVNDAKTFLTISFL